MARRGGWLVLFVLLGLGGCVIEAPPSGPPAPPPLAEQIREEALRESPGGEVVLADRRFASGVWDLRVEVQRTATLGAPPGDDDMARLLALFAWSLERAPSGEVVGAPQVAMEMRKAAREMRLAGPPGSPPVRDAFGRGLRLGVETLLALARGPYGDASGVASRADELAEQFSPSNDFLPAPGYAGMVEVLRRAVFLMESMIQARGMAGEGGVRSERSCWPCR